MKTKILLIGLTIFLVNVISVNARETIKACGPHDDVNEYSALYFPSDGSRPHGRDIEMLLILTNKLNLELIAIKGKDYNECFTKMRTGEIDLMTNLGDKDDRRDYMELFPYAQCSMFKWKCKGDQNIYFGLSKKSKFISRISEFKSAVAALSPEYYIVIYNNNFTSSDEHSWNGKDPNTLRICQIEWVNKEKGEVFFKWDPKEQYPYGAMVETGNHFAKKIGKKPLYFRSYYPVLAVETGFCDISFGWEKHSAYKVDYFAHDEGIDVFAIVPKSSNLLNDLKKVGPISKRGSNKIFRGVKYTSNYDHYFSEYEEMLGGLYTVYAQLKSFHEARKGYQAVYVSSHEMKKIKEMTKSTESLIFEKEPHLVDRSDGIWNRRTRIISEYKNNFHLWEQYYILDTKYFFIPPFSGVYKVPSQWKSSNKKVAGNMILFLETLATIIGKQSGGTGQKSDKDF